MEKLSKEAKFKLRTRMVDSAEKIGISETARLFRVNRNTVSHWLKRYQQEGEAGLQNRSKKGVIYPNKMPLDLEKKIVAFKRKNPNASATKIIKDLKLNYSVSIIVKKLKDAGLWKAQKVRLNLNVRTGIASYELIFISISKLDSSNYKKIPGYYFSACDYLSGFTYHSFSYDNYEPSIAAFIEYIFQNLSQQKISTELVQIVPLKKSIISYSKRKKSAINTTLQKYNSTIKYISEDKRKEFLKFIARNNFINWLQHEKFSSLVDLMAKSHIFCLGKNLKFNFNYSPLPIIPCVISYISSDFPDNELFQKSKEVFLTSVNLSKEMVEKHIAKFEYDKALNNLEILLLLIKNNSDYEALKIKSLIKKGKLLKNSGTLKQTEIVLQQAAKLAILSKDKDLMAKSYFTLGEYYNDIEKTYEALIYFEDTIKLAKAADNEILELKAAINLALRNLKTGHSRKALGLLTFYLKKAQALENLPLIVDFNMGMARYYSSKGNKLKVKEHLLKAENLAEKINSPEAFFRVYYPILSMSFKSKMPDSFLNSYKEKMNNLIPKLKDRLKVLNALNSVGCAEINLRNHDEALKIFLKQLNLAEKLKLKFMICSALINIGNRFMNVGKNNNAFNYLVKGYEISQEIQFYEGIFSSCVNICSILSNQRKLEEAIKYNTKGLVLAKQLGNKHYLASFLLILGTIQLEQKKAKAATTQFRKALKIALETQNNSQIATAYNNISVAYSDLGKLKNALQFVDKALALVSEYKNNYHLCLFTYNKARYLFKNFDYNSALDTILITEDLAAKISNKYLMVNGAKLRRKILENIKP